MRLDVHRATRLDERRHVGDRVAHAVPGPVSLEMQRLVEIHRLGRVDRDERDGRLVRLGSPGRVRGSLRIGLDLGREVERDVELTPELRERRLDLRTPRCEPELALRHALQRTEKARGRAVDSTG